MLPRARWVTSALYPALYSHEGDVNTGRGCSKSPPKGQQTKGPLGTFEEGGKGGAMASRLFGASTQVWAVQVASLLTDASPQGL